MIFRRIAVSVRCIFRHTVQHVNDRSWWGPRTFLVEITNLSERAKDDWLCQLGFLSMVRERTTNVRQICIAHSKNHGECSGRKENEFKSILFLKKMFFLMACDGINLFYIYIFIYLFIYLFGILHRLPQKVFKNPNKLVFLFEGPCNLRVFAPTQIDK
jgi:hypothetical protein